MAVNKAGITAIVLVAVSWAQFTTAVLGPDGRTRTPDPPKGWVPPVLAKLNPSICNYKTGQISAANLDRVKRQAAAAGLQYDEALPVHCWFKFKQTGSQAQTQKALAALTMPQQGQTGSAAVSSTGEPLPFALAEYDQLMHTMQPNTVDTAAVGKPGAAGAATAAVVTSRGAAAVKPSHMDRSSSSSSSSSSSGSDSSSKVKIADKCKSSSGSSGSLMVVGSSRSSGTSS